MRHQISARQDPCPELGSSLSTPQTSTTRNLVAAASAHEGSERPSPSAFPTSSTSSTLAKPKSWASPSGAGLRSSLPSPRSSTSRPTSKPRSPRLPNAEQLRLARGQRSCTCRARHNRKTPAGRQTCGGLKGSRSLSGDRSSDEPDRTPIRILVRNRVVSMIVARVLRMSSTRVRRVDASIADPLGFTGREATGVDT